MEVRDQISQGMPAYSTPTSFAYEVNPNNNNAIGNSEENRDPNPGIVRNFNPQVIFQAQAQAQSQGQVQGQRNGQMQTLANNHSNNSNPYAVAQVLSAINSSLEANSGEKMNNGNNHPSQLNIPGNSTPRIPSNNAKMNVPVNSLNGTQNVANVAQNGNQNAVMNFSMLNPNLFRHLSYDAATAALLMNPQAAAHVAVAAQAAVASVAHQLVNQNPAQAPVPHNPQPQQHHAPQHPPQQTHHPKLPQSSLSNTTHEIAPSAPPPNSSIPNNNYAMNSLKSNNIPLGRNKNVGPNAPVSTNVKPLSQDNNMGVSEAIQVLLKNPATAQAVAAAVANGIKLQTPPNRTQRSPPPQPPAQPHRQHPHNSTTSPTAHVPVVNVNNSKKPRPMMTPVPGTIHSMPPPSKNLGLQSMISIQNMRAGGKKPLLTPIGGNPLENMRNWKLEELEAHVRLLQDTNQNVPQPLALLLADARRKEEKRTAKRVANRKSACTSRARKKALVEEMTRTNAKLKRQALILSLLPDLVVAITVDGEITFCSAQVERVLRHSVNDLVGSNLMDILLPASKEALQHLIGVLLAAEANEMTSQSNRNKEDNGGSLSSSAESSNDVAIVSEQSFPLSVVKVMGPDKNSPKKSSSNGNTTSSNGSSDEKGKNNLTNSSLGNSSSQSLSDEDRAARSNKSNNGNNRNRGMDGSSSSPRAGANLCDETSSSESKLRASEALNRNVQHHKDQLCKDKMEQNNKHKDDVTGASVTANNADARLSSLQHCPKNGNNQLTMEEKSDSKKNSISYENLEVQSSSSASSDSLLSGVEEKPPSKANTAPSQRPPRGTNENESEDSGFRAGSENSGSSDDSSTNQQNGQRPKPLAPTCNICLIREDLSTIWCEVTSSIRTRSLHEETPETAVILSSVKAVVSSTSSSNAVVDNKEQNAPKTVKELLLCLRPIREGEEKVTEVFRFKTKAFKGTIADKDECKKSETDKAVNGSSPTIGNGIGVPVLKRPMKKRPFFEMKKGKSTVLANGSGSKPIMPNHAQAVVADVTSATEKSVVESLMLMSHKKQRNEE